MSAPCPFCLLGGGFHDEAIHAAIELPADKVMTKVRPVADVCKNRNCAQPFDSPGMNGCRNPRHAA